MLITKTVMVKWNGANKKWYEDRGYIYTKQNEEFEVKSEDLPPSAKNSLTICCDKCEKGIKTVRVESYTKIYKDKYLCKECKEQEYRCVVCGKIDEYRGLYEGDYYCAKHLFHMKRYGKILERTTFDDNEYIIHEDFVEIFLYNKQCEIIESTFISLDKLDLIKQYKWSLHDSGNKKYKRVITSLRNDKNTSMHRLIMNLQDADSKIFVDHIDGNPLNNRTENLRECSCIENNRNHNTLFSTNTSGYTGVSFHKASGKWRARVKLNDKEIYLGIFANIEDAIIAREKGELKYYGEFSPHYKELIIKYPNIIHNEARNQQEAIYI